jgi:DnaJ family protein C protein 28
MPEQPPADAGTSSASDEQQRQRRKTPLQKWADLVDDQIRAAQEQGDFDNLPGAGKPLKLDDNPYAGDRALAFHLLQQNHMLPRELDIGHELDAEIARAEKLLAELRRQRDWLLKQQGTSGERARAAYARLREEYAGRYEQALREIRSKILTLNIIAPTTMHRPLIDVAEQMRAFQQEFPPLKA